MSYSPPSFQISEGPTPYNNSDNRQSPFQLNLTPEEIKVLKQCKEEGIYQRSIPLGILFSIGGLYGARNGRFMHAKMGVYPAVVGFGLLGYIIGRISYSQTCFRRVLEVPNGNLRKMYYRENNAESPIYNYDSVEIPKSQEQSVPTQNSVADIDLPSVTNYDFTPSEYYTKVSDDVKDEKQEVKNFTSYDELRRQNRQEFSNKLNESSQSRYRGQNNPNLRPLPPPSSTQEPIYSDRTGGQKTKYGDIWE